MHAKHGEKKSSKEKPDIMEDDEGKISLEAYRKKKNEEEKERLEKDLLELSADQNTKYPEGFGAALLRGFGWDHGKPIGKTRAAVVPLVQLQSRPFRLGLGAKPPQMEPKITQSSPPHCNDAVNDE